MVALFGPELYLEKRLARPGSRHRRVEPGSLVTHGAVAVVTVGGAHAVSTMRDLAETSDHQGRVLWAESVAEAEKHRRQPLYETCWNHTTLHAMRYAREKEEITCVGQRIVFEHVLLHSQLNVNGFCHVLIF